MGYQLLYSNPPLTQPCYQKHPTTISELSMLSEVAWFSRISIQRQFSRKECVAHSIKSFHERFAGTSSGSQCTAKISRLSLLSIRTAFTGLIVKDSLLSWMCFAKFKTWNRWPGSHCAARQSPGLVFPYLQIIQPLMGLPEKLSSSLQWWSAMKV